MRAMVSRGAGAFFALPNSLIIGLRWSVVAVVAVSFFKQKKQHKRRAPRRSFLKNKIQLTY
jgi:hypothetical protein